LGNSLLLHTLPTPAHCTSHLCHTSIISRYLFLLLPFSPFSLRTFLRNAVFHAGAPCRHLPCSPPHRCTAASSRAHALRLRAAASCTHKQGLPSCKLPLLLPHCTPPADRLLLPTIPPVLPSAPSSPAWLLCYTAPSSPHYLLSPPQFGGKEDMVPWAVGNTWAIHCLPCLVVLP